MSKITRPGVNFPIFGSNAPAGDIKIFGEATASTDITALLTNTNALGGWGSGVDANGAPAMEWFNAVGYTFSTITAYLLQAGVPEWVAEQEYYIGSRAVASDGFTYISKTGTVGSPNLGNNPVGDTTNWRIAYLDITNTVAFTPTSNYHPATKIYVDNSIAAIANTNIIGVRQTIREGALDTSGLPTFLTIGAGLSIDIAATAIPIIVHVAGGSSSLDRIGTLSIDTNLAGLTDNATNYLYMDVDINGSVTLGATVTEPIYQFAGTPSVVLDDYTFNVSEMTSYLGDGATANKVYRYFFGMAVTSGGSVTSVVAYALNGYYTSALTPLPSTNTLQNFNHNIGINPEFLIWEYTGVITVAVGNLAIGDKIKYIYSYDAASRSIDLKIGMTKYGATIGGITNSGFRAVDPVTFSAVLALTTANCSTYQTIKRGW